MIENLSMDGLVELAKCQKEENLRLKKSLEKIHSMLLSSKSEVKIIRYTEKEIKNYNQLGAGLWQ